jgi:predicted MFS family arabinose efflux permease
MLAISAVLQGLGFVVWFFSYSFLMFALGFALWALSGAFASGTEEGLIYDNLKSDEREEDFAKVYGKAQFFANIGILVGVVSAGAIVNFVSIATIALISALICFINVIFALQIREKNYYSEQSSGKESGFFDTFKEAGVFIKGNTVALISILFLVFFSLVGYLDEFDALIISDFELNNIWVSIIFGVRFIFIAIGDVLAPVVQKKISSLKQIFLLNCLSYMLLLVFAAVWNQYVIFIFGFACMVMAISNILLVNVLQNEIKEEGRATVMSFYSVGQNIAMICFSLVYAWLAGILPLQQVYVILSVYGLIGGLAFFLLLGVIKARA